jgi:hypothetical protein
MLEDHPRENFSLASRRPLAAISLARGPVHKKTGPAAPPLIQRRHLPRSRATLLTLRAFHSYGKSRTWAFVHRVIRRYPLTTRGTGSGTTATAALVAPLSLLLVGLACIALHLAGVGTSQSIPSRLRRR